MGRISVVVLGDIGRSPRMQYHSISLANLGHQVDLIGYSGSKPHRLIMENEKIALRYLKEMPSNMQNVIGLIFKCLWQAWTLFWCLMWTVAKPDTIFVQNPPGLPALFICWMAARLRGAKFIIDWHNFTYSILTLKWHPMNPIVKLVKSYEMTVGAWADDSLCVSKAMMAYLRILHGINPKTFYDRPLKNVFRPINLDERHEIMKRMAEASPDIFGDVDGGQNDKTKFTEQSVNGFQLRQDRPAFLISSTSWTADENFDILFDALQSYDQKLNSSLPKIVCVITGKGPLKEYYLKKMPEYDHIQICTPWLAAEDYPLLMACTDLGVCLHTSTCGFDLPMKAVDMLGCRVPVLALKYDSIDELVKENENGKLFTDSTGLCQQLVDLLTNFNGRGGQKCQLEELKIRLNDGRNKDKENWDWESNWTEIVEPIFH